MIRVFRGYLPGVNPVVLQIASGNAFFIAIGMTVVAFAWRLWLSRRVWVSLLTIAWLVGASLLFADW